MKSQNPLVNNLKLKYNTLDLRMKQLLLNLLILMSKDLAAIQVRYPVKENDESL